MTAAMLIARAAVLLVAGALLVALPLPSQAHHPPHSAKGAAVRSVGDRLLAAVHAPTVAPATNPQRAPTTCDVPFDGKTLSYAGCAKLTAGIEVFWTIDAPRNEIHTLTRSQTAGGWLGFGWGFDNMRGSRVTIAFADPSDKPVVLNYFLADYKSPAVQPDPSIPVYNLSAAFDGQFVAARFSRKLTAPGLPDVVAGPMLAIWAKGPRPESPNKLQYHSGHDLGKIHLTNTVSVASVSGSPPARFVAHGVLMVLAWLLLLPNAVIAMRYFKRFNPTTFLAHRAMAATAVGATLVAALLAVPAASHTHGRHMIFGYTVVVLSVLQTIGGMLRPPKGGPGRGTFVKGHRFFGLLATAGGAINCFIGLALLQAGSGLFAVAVILVSITVLSHVHFGLQPHKFPRRDPKDEVEGMLVTNAEETSTLSRRARSPGLGVQ